MSLYKNAGNSQKRVTLEDVIARQEELLAEIKKKEEKMSNYSQQIFAPFLSSSENNHSLIKKINTGVAIFDGAVIGLKLFKSFRKIFSKRR